MACRVLVAGGRDPVDYVRLRDALDKLLTNRMPEVQILTAGGVPALEQLASGLEGSPRVIASHTAEQHVNCPRPMSDH
jgi:hypothetical protein